MVDGYDYQGTVESAFLIGCLGSMCGLTLVPNSGLVQRANFS